MRFAITDLKLGRQSRALMAVIALVTTFIFTNDWSSEENHTQPVEKPEKIKPTENAALATETITVNGVVFEMLAIKGDRFQMGSPDDEPERGSDEKQHEITVADFQMGKYEVTQSQWQAVMNNNPAYFKGDDLPVEQVNWDDVQVFISRLNQSTEKTGHKFRLPTEAEWEYAARAKTNTPFYPYDGKGDCITATYANFTTYPNFKSDYNNKNCGAKNQNSVGKTVVVNSYQPNAFGLYNMVGNVWEWTCSVYVENYDGSEKECSSNNNANIRLVLRGGAWSIYELFYLRSAKRISTTSGERSDNIGFRLSRM